MTLCIAWIRQEKEQNQELVFATDSMLTGGGETWKHGVKTSLNYPARIVYYALLAILIKHIH